MRRKYTYLILSFLGFALPYSQFIPWVQANGLNLKFFAQQLLANRIGAFFGLDVLVSAIVLFSFVRNEGHRLGMRRLWAPIIVTLLIGVSFGFPLFLYFRELALEGERVTQPQ